MSEAPSENLPLWVIIKRSRQGQPAVLGPDRMHLCADSRLELHLGVVQLGQHVDVQQGEHGLGDKVEHSVKDHLGGRGDVVGTVSETPGDGVKGPDKGEENGRGDVGALEV